MSAGTEPLRAALSRLDAAARTLFMAGGALSHADQRSIDEVVEHLEHACLALPFRAREQMAATRALYATGANRDVPADQVEVGDQLKWCGIYFLVTAVVPTDAEIWVWATIEALRAKIEFTVPRTQWLTVRMAA